MKRLFLICSLLILSISLFAQSEWAPIPMYYFSWSNSSSSTTNSYISAWNTNHYVYGHNVRDMTDYEERNNFLTYDRMEMKVLPLGVDSFKITFDVVNTHNKNGWWYEVVDEKGRHHKYSDFIEWGIEIEYEDSNHHLDWFTTKFHQESHYYVSGTYRTTHYKSGYSSWKESYYRNEMPSTITLNNGYLQMKVGESSKSVSNIRRVTKISLLLGPASNVEIKNFCAEKKTPFADQKPYLDQGFRYNNTKDYWSAIKSFQKAQELGYDGYDLYYGLATSYYNLQLYSNAIANYNSAISRKATEDAYLYRGLCKIETRDPSFIDDLKKGGIKGEALAKEIEASISANTTSQSNSSKYAASGTGFFINSTGYVVTNEHVIDGTNGIDVIISRDGHSNTYSAKVFVSDKANDLAVLKIEDDSFKPLPPVPYSFSSKTKDVGSSVFAMGYPVLASLGDEIKVTDGIISSKTGYQGDVSTYQISAPIQPGNSGGPLFDSNGNVVGVTSSGVQSLQNVGYAIKISFLLNLLEVSDTDIAIPTTNKISSLSLTQKIKSISPYVVIVLVY